MNTYIIHLENKSGYEWVSDNGETEIVEAASLKEALNNITHLESIWNDMYEALDKNANATFTPKELLPLKITITEIPAIGKVVSSADIQQTLQKMIDDQRAQLLNDVAHQKQLDQQKAADVARIKTEMDRLGLKAEDLG